MKKLARLTSIQELYELFGHLFPEHLLAASDVGTNSRERVFTPQVTFWAFVAQILSPGSSCREIVRRVAVSYTHLKMTALRQIDKSLFLFHRQLTFPGLSLIHI